MPSDYAKTLGARLRAIRTQQGLSLHGVEEKSRGRWKAVVVGSYERGDRSVTVQKLAELADFYGVPVSELLPGDAGPGVLTPAPKLVIDLEGAGWAALPLRRDHPEPARRLQRPGPFHPSGRPALPGGHLRQVAIRPHRGIHQLGHPRLDRAGRCRVGLTALGQAQLRSRSPAAAPPARGRRARSRQARRTSRRRAAVRRPRGRTPREAGRPQPPPACSRPPRRTRPTH